MKIWMSLFLVASAVAMTASVASAVEFDVCVDPRTGARADEVSFVASGIVLPGGTIPAGGVESCDSLREQRIGAFFAKGSFVVGLPTSGNKDVAFADWHLRIRERGAINTSGIVRNAATYPHTVVGATEEFTNLLQGTDGRALVQVLDEEGFQVRMILLEPGQPQ